MKAMTVLVLMLLMLFSPDHSYNAAVQAICVWGLDVVPSLFPYMVLCQSLLSQLKQKPALFSFAAPFLGFLGGSPAGSAALAQSHCESSISYRRMLGLCTLCGTISPMFFLGPFSSWLNSHTAGRQLLAAHWIAAFLSGLFVQHSFPTFSPVKPVYSAAHDENVNPISRSINSVLNVGGCIVFYSAAASSVCSALPFISDTLRAVLWAAAEVSGGLKALCECNLPTGAKLILCAAVSGFSGLSILTQNLVFLRHLGIRMKHLVCLGLIRAGFSALIMGCILLIPTMP